jgi:hypothetical protein
MALMAGLRVWIEMSLNQRVVVRGQPDGPNSLAGFSDPPSPEKQTLNAGSLNTK